MKTETKHALGIILSGAVLSIAVAWAMATLAPPAHAADLGGNCCADLEERIAELEATSATKGNKKITLEIDGQINGGYTYATLGDFHEGRITSSNGNDRSVVGFTGEAKIMDGWSAGYRLEIDIEQIGLAGPVGHVIGNNDETGVRQSYWFLKNKQLGKVSVGKAAQATSDLDEWSVSQAWIAGKPLSLGSLSDLYLTSLDTPFDGGYRTVVRYDSATWEGFTLSATWGDSLDIKDPNGNGRTYDAALRYLNDVQDFKVMGSVGYRRSTDLEVNLLGITTITVPTGDVDTFLASGSVMHMPTGIFGGVSYAHQDYSDLNFTLAGLDVTAGIEQRFFKPLGKTTIAGSWGRFAIDAGGFSPNVNYYGLSLVQAIDQAAMDVYLGYRHYDLSDVASDNADVITAGAVIHF